MTPEIVVLVGAALLALAFLWWLSGWY